AGVYARRSLRIDAARRKTRLRVSAARAQQAVHSQRSSLTCGRQLIKSVGLEQIATIRIHFLRSRIVQRLGAHVIVFVSEFVFEAQHSLTVVEDRKSTRLNSSHVAIS